MKIDKTIKKETIFLIYGMAILSVLMEAVYLLTGNWSIWVLIANLIGGGISVFNFFLMGIDVQKCMDMDPEDAKRKIKVSQQLRTLMLFTVICAAASLTAFGVVSEEETFAYIIALLLPLIFNRITIAIRAHYVVE